MIKKIKNLSFVFIAIIIAYQPTMAQVDVEKKAGYEFETVNSIECTPVKSQGNTGTCWSFATSSFTLSGYGLILFPMSPTAAAALSLILSSGSFSIT